jgi:transcription termination/antitermination protein NusA
MTSGLADAIRGLVQDRGIPEELVRKTIEDFLIAAYKKKFGTTENAVVRFSEDGSEVAIFAQKEIVEDVEDPVTEISLEEALDYNDECEVGDELLIEVNPQSFDRIAVQSAKQKAKQTLREIQKDTLYSEYKDKEGEMIIGYYQRERNGNIFVDLGKVEGIMPKRYQSPREVYRPNDRIKAMIYEVNKSNTGLQIVLSRTHAEFVKRIFELEVPEVYDKTVEIYKIVREPGYRTKLAVYSNREDIDPVGACVGMKGVRIQAIVRELEGEKIDILKYETDPRLFIKNALSPAEVDSVYILDEAKRQALAVVKDTQLSLAIGKQGLNVRLANRLVDWNIDVKTEEQFGELDIAEQSKQELNALFTDIETEEEITNISELPGISERLAQVLYENGIELIETLIQLAPEELSRLEGITDQDVDTIQSIISENLDIIEAEEEAVSEEAEEFEEEEEAEQAEEELDEDEAAVDTEPSEEYEEEEETETEEEVYECPECGHPITIDMTSCPNCGVGLSFEVEEEDEE